MWPIKYPDPSSIYIKVATDNGTINIEQQDGLVTYTPQIGFNGRDSFIYTVSNTRGEVSNEATVSITVGDVASNTPPPSSPPAPTNSAAVVEADSASGGGTLSMLLMFGFFLSFRRVMAVDKERAHYKEVGQF